MKPDDLTRWEFQHEIAELCDSLQRQRESAFCQSPDPPGAMVPHSPHDSVVGIVSDPDAPLLRYLARAAARDAAKVAESNRRAHLSAQHNFIVRVVSDPDIQLSRGPHV